MKWAIGETNRKKFNRCNECEKIDFCGGREKKIEIVVSIQEVAGGFWGRKRVNWSRWCVQGWCFLGGFGGLEQPGLAGRREEEAGAAGREEPGSPGHR